MAKAVIKTGGKQYLVADKTVLRIEKLAAEAGNQVTFDEVLMIQTGKSIKIGTPLVSGASVTAKIVGHGRLPKVTGVKMKAKKRYKKIFGHKQHFTEVAIIEIAT